MISRVTSIDRQDRNTRDFAGCPIPSQPGRAWLSACVPALLAFGLCFGCIGIRTPLDPSLDAESGAADARVGADLGTDRGTDTSVADGAREASVEAARDSRLGDSAGADGGTQLPDARDSASLEVGVPDAVQTDLRKPDAIQADLRTPDAVQADLLVADAPISDAAFSSADAAVSGPVLTVVKLGTGEGTVTSSPAGIQCGSTCSASFANSTVVLTASTANGSDARFAGWGGACSGRSRTCTVTVTAPTTVTAQFDPIDHNLVFLSSVRTFTTDLGGTAAYDQQCNQLATAAGINNSTGDAYIAWISDSHSSARDRIGSARGFVRLDGEPVADDAVAMVRDLQIYNPINVDETGSAPAGGGTVLTGMNSSGNPDPTMDCNDWTVKSNAASVTAGCAACGPPTWYYWEGGTCDRITGGLYCFMTTKTAALTITPRSGRKLFVTNGPVTIGQSADTACDSAKPAGTGSVVALRATTTTAASSFIDSTATYVRPDGILVGQGSDLIAGTLKSGVWQQGNGKYVNHAVWTGSGSPSALGTTASTCANWTSQTGDNIPGSTASTDSVWWQDPISWTCASTYTWSYCIEQ